MLPWEEDNMKEQLDIHGIEIKRAGSPGWHRSMKRLCLARKWQWLFTAPRPFHPFLLEELRELHPHSAIAHPAGALVEGKSGEIYPLLMGIRTASKVYLIIDSFRAGAAEELFRRISLLPWELLLPGRGPCKVKAHLNRCRIAHEGAAAETVSRGIEKRLSEAAAPGTEAASSIILYGEENRMELRLDISGEHLHRRGYRRYVSDAPIRETIAASLLFWYKALRGPFSHLYDPMCGAATFSIEGWAMAAQVPLGAWRPYPLMELPFFSRKSWDWEIKRWLEMAQGLNQHFKGTASDGDAKIVESARKNIEQIAHKVDFPVAIDLSQADFFDLEPGSGLGMDESRGRSLLVLNPPYGKRLRGREHQTALSDLYQAILRRWNGSWPGWDLLLILPQGIRSSLFEGAKAMDRISFHNGGIPVTAFLFPSSTPQAQEPPPQNC